MTIIRRLGSGDVELMEAANQLFGEVFGEKAIMAPRRAATICSGCLTTGNSLP